MISVITVWTSGERILGPFPIEGEPEKVKYQLAQGGEFKVERESALYEIVELYKDSSLNLRLQIDDFGNLIAVEEPQFPILIDPGEGVLIKAQNGRLIIGFQGLESFATNVGIFLRQVADCLGPGLIPKILRRILHQFLLQLVACPYLLDDNAANKLREAADAIVASILSKPDKPSES